MKVEPILAVQDVNESSKWYQNLFDCRSIHDGNDFDILVSKEDEVILCLHKWGAHDHPTMQNPNLTPGNGLIIYFRTEHMENIRENLRGMNHDVEADIQINPNSNKKEFSVIDPNGYHLIISEFHTYQG